MTATVAGIFKGGKLELLEEPFGLQDGRVKVTIEEDSEGPSDMAACDRRAFLRLPLAERRRILKEQADKLITHYEEDKEWHAWLAGDIVEY